MMTSFNKEDWKNNIIREKRLHKEKKTSQDTSMSERKHMKYYTCTFHHPQTHLGISCARPLIDLQLQESTHYWESLDCSISSCRLIAVTCKNFQKLSKYNTYKYTRIKTLDLKIRVLYLIFECYLLY